MLNLVAARGPGHGGEGLELSRDLAAQLGTLDVLQGFEDPGEAEPRIIGITVGLEAPAVVAQGTEKTFVFSNQDGKPRSGGIAQWPVSPYSPYVLSLYQVGVRMVGGVSGSFHRVTGHWGESSKFSFHLRISGMFVAAPGCAENSNRHAVSSLMTARTHSCWELHSQQGL